MKKVLMFLAMAAMFLVNTKAQADLIYSVEQIGGSNPIVIGNTAQFGIFLRTDLVGGNAGIPTQQPAGVDLTLELADPNGAAGRFTSGSLTITGGTGGFGQSDFDAGGTLIFFGSRFPAVVFPNNTTAVEIARLTLDTTGATVGTYNISLADFFATDVNFSSINGSALGVPSYTIAAVPEPSSMALLGCVALGGYVIRRRRRSVKA
ncbi:MAG: PEP-CTERM sorting domain-containing protein [Pirellula sp.]|jgi:hypothetical protein